MMLVVGLVAAILAVGCCWICGLLVADRLLAGTSVVVRLGGAFCLTFWISAWLFEILALAGVFRLSVVMAVAVLGPLAGLWYWRSRVAEVLGRVRTESRAEARALASDLWQHRWIALGLGLVAAHVGMRMVRSLATPALGWDDFTYHLFRAGRWVQNSGIVLEPAPDSWTYYEFFPWGGDLVWAWTLVWGVGDVLVPLGAIAMWCGVLLGGYAVARELGQERSTALVVAAAIAVLPSQISQLSTAYVDNAVLAMVLFASLFLWVYLAGTAGEGAALMLGIACGLGLLVKMSFLPLLAPAAIIVLWWAIRRRSYGDLLGFAAGVAVALPNLLFNWAERGSPFYPFEIWRSLPYNAQHSWILSRLGEGASPAELVRAAKALVVNDSAIDPFLNVGVLGVLLLVLGILGSTTLLGSQRGRWFLLWAYAGGVITLVTFFSPKNSSMFAWWTLVMGRLLVPSLAGLLVSSGLVAGRIARGLLMPVLLVEIWIYGRRQWPGAMTAAFLEVFAVILAVAGLWFLLRRSRWRKGPVWPIVIASLTIALLALIGVREHFRWAAYRLHGERQLFDFHGVPPVQAWPMWREVDGPEPSRIAVTAGYDPRMPHNWFRWPFLGTRLQNDVVYLPVTADGEIVSYFDREALVEAADRTAWLQRVAAQEVDWIAALGPATLEHRWVLELPRIFPLEISMGENHFLLARVDHGALASYLSSLP